LWRIAAVLAVLGGAAVLPACASQPADQTYRVDDSSRLFTAVMIDGQGPFTFVLDTAASRTLLYEHVRARLGLTRSQPGDLTVYGIKSLARALPVKPGVLAVAGEQISGLTLGVLPDNSKEEAGVDGILGIDVLARYFVVLDRNTMRLMLLAPDSAAAARYRDWPVTALTPRLLKNAPVNFWYIQGQIGRTSFNSLFDLGAGFSLMNWAAAARLGLHKSDFERPQPLPVVVRDMLGTDEPVVRLDGLDIGLRGRDWYRQTVVVANSDIFSHFNLDEQPAAILGAGLLKDNSLAIDFANHRLYIGPDFAEPLPRG
jgi:predicted aspartyl protease